MFAIIFVAMLIRCVYSINISLKKTLDRMDFAVKRQMDIESDGVKFRLAIQQSESMREM